MREQCLCSPSATPGIGDVPVLDDGVMEVDAEGLLDSRHILHLINIRLAMFRESNRSHRVR